MHRNVYYLLVPLLLVVMALPLLFDNPFYLRIATEAIMWIGLAITWDLLAGYTGYLNFGHAMFFGIGAYTTAILMKSAGWAFILTVPVGGLLAGLVAFVIGVPTLRLKGAYFAIGTWALALAVQQLALVLGITGGPDGMRLPPFLDPAYFYYWMLGVVGVTFGLYWILLERAPFGLKVRAIREDQEGAMALGINPTRVKIQAFILSAIPVGILGSIYAYWITFINPHSALGDILTDQAVVMAVVGGLGTLIGPAIGAVIVFAFKTLFWTYLSDYQVLYLIILGAAIALTVVFLPDGLWGTFVGYRESKPSAKKESERRPRIDTGEDAKPDRKGEFDHA
jgi:branched-chain amino acid transport system permease protein